MTHPHVHDRDATRRNQQLKRERRERAAVEWLPELLPAVCPACGVALGLVVAGGELLCRACGVWAPADDLAREHGIAD